MDVPIDANVEDKERDSSPSASLSRILNAVVWQRVPPVRDSDEFEESDSPYMSTSFRRHTGISPSDFRSTDNK